MSDIEEERFLEEQEAEDEGIIKGKREKGKKVFGVELKQSLEIEDLEKHLMDLTLQREEIHLADLKRQRRALESSGEQIECPECNIKKTDEDEDCPECRIKVGVGMYLNICKELDSEENCQDLFEEVDSGKITPDEFFDIVKEKAKDDPEKLDILEYTDELMESEDAGTKGNPKKDVKPEVESTSNPVIMRKPRPSPSISATSVVVGTVMTGGDGNLWEVKAYKRGDKTIQHWVRYDGTKGNPKPKRVEILENEYNHYVEDGLKVTLLRAGKENTDDFRGGTWYVNQIYEGQRISYQEGAVGRSPVGVGGSKVYKKVVVLKNPYIMEWKEGHTEGQIVVDLAEDILGKEKSNQLKKGITGYEAEQSFARLEREISKELKNRGCDSVFVVAKVGSQPAIPQQTFILG